MRLLRSPVHDASQELSRHNAAGARHLFDRLLGVGALGRAGTAGGGVSAFTRLRWWLDDHQPAPPLEWPERGRIDWLCAAIWIGSALFCVAVYFGVVILMWRVWQAVSQ